jgi:predicted choloylglycine hydrolase
MKIEYYHGTYYNIGRQIGKYYKKHNYKITQTRIKESLLKQQLNIYKKYYPEILDEIQGIADEINMNLKTLQYVYLCTLLDYFKGCSIFSYGNLIGRNYDWNLKTRDMCSLWYAKVKNKNPFFAISDGVSSEREYGKFQELLNCCDIINNKYLFIGLTAVIGRMSCYGLTYFHFMRKLSETCTTIEDVLSMIKKIPLSGAKTFFVGDKSGKSVVIEHNGKFQYKVLYQTNNLLIQTNHFVDKELFTKYDHIKKHPTWYKNSLDRYNKIKDLVEKNKPTNLKEIKKILDTPPVLDKTKEGTLWQLVMDLKRKLIYFTFGKKTQKIIL